MEYAEWRGFFDPLDAEEERRGTVAVQNAGASLDDQGGVLAGFGWIAEKFRFAVRCRKTRYHAGLMNAKWRLQNAEWSGEGKPAIAGARWRNVKC